MREKWLPIRGFEGLYEVSNLGNIRSLDRSVKRNGKTLKFLRGKILKKQKYSNGYLFVSLSVEGKVKGFSVSRLVATHFIENPNNLPEVNHINEDKNDNRCENLEWISHKDNINHGTAIERRTKNSDFSGSRNPMFGKKGILNKCATPVQVFKDDRYIGSFPSIAMAAEILELNSSLVARVANGFNSHTKGYFINKL